MTTAQSYALAVPATLAIDPVAGASTSADILIQATDDDGRRLAGVDVTVFVDRGAISDGHGPFANQAFGTTDSAGLVRFRFTASRRDAIGVTPGVATIMAVVSRPGLPSQVISTSLTLIGPPALITLSAAPPVVAPGSLVAVTAHVKDAIGQDVVDGTEVSFSVVPPSQLLATSHQTRAGAASTFLETGQSFEGLYQITARSAGVQATVTVVATNPVARV